MNKSLKFDIFCKVVDNFGDIGFCWRLAKQLASEHDCVVKLWVDDWHTAEKLIPELASAQGESAHVADVNVAKWGASTHFDSAADVALETFACGLPETYQQAMQTQQTLWVNIDHLSAEAWVDDFHAQASPQANGLKKYFYFPGFTEKTGGLLREQTKRNASFDVSEHLNISLFGYPHAPISDLFDAMIASQQTTVCYVPESILLPTIATYFGQASVRAGDTLNQANLTVEVLPFLSQDDYDALLRSCDVNFVRGEDSWVRAIWAGKPFIWQPYQQAEEAHQPKLAAFLDAFYEQPLGTINTIQHAWNSGALSVTEWANYLDKLSDIRQQTSHAKQKQMAQTDLASQLVVFCHQQLLSSS